MSNTPSEKLLNRIERLEEQVRFLKIKSLKPGQELIDYYCEVCKRETEHLQQDHHMHCKYFLTDCTVCNNRKYEETYDEWSKRNSTAFAEQAKKDLKKSVEEVVIEAMKKVKENI